jgi:muramoyltetrapeptide carboxypeptidase
VGVTPTTSSGLIKFRPLRPGGRVALVAPASAFDRAEFDAGVAELKRLGFEPVWDDTVFERRAMTAGDANVRVRAFERALDQLGADAVVAVRGGYGSVELLPGLDVERIRKSRTAFVGYSDLTSLHSYLGAVAGMASVHGTMVEGRLAKGPAAYDPVTFLKSLSTEAIGRLPVDDLQTLSRGSSTASGPLAGGTITQLLASFGTPYEFKPPDDHVLFLEEVNERPYRLHRMLTQLRLSGRLRRAAAIVFGEMPGCDEPGGKVTARDVVRDFIEDFRGPVVFGVPSGHSTRPTMSLPLGVRTTVAGHAGEASVTIEEAAAAD